MSRPIIEAQGVSKRYELGHVGMTTFRDELQRLLGQAPARAATREFWALRDVSFTIEPGVITGIIGRNGAGKSTLLKILSRITEPTAGEIHLHGRVASLLEVGTGFHPELSGRENIFLNGTILGMTRTEISRKFDEIVAFAEVEQFIDTPVKHYSSGMYVRLAFAIAAHLEPEILVVDEVLAVGDAQFQRKCIGRMQEISRGQGGTILIVSHQMDTILRLCTRAILLEKGRVKAIGTPNEVLPLYYQETDAVLSPGLVIDLSRRTRAGSGGARFTSFSYEIISAPSLNCPYPGCSIRFTVKIHSAKKQSVGGLALYFETEAETKLLNFDLQRVLFPIPLLAGENTFVIETPSIPINAMPIKASLWMADTSKAHVIDEVKHFCRLDFIELATVTNAPSKMYDGLILLPGIKLSIDGAPHLVS